VPVEAVKIWLTLTVPETTGGEVLTGLAGVAAEAEEFDDAEPLPPAFDAVTTTRRKSLRSPESTV